MNTDLFLANAVCPCLSVKDFSLQLPHSGTQDHKAPVISSILIIHSSSTVERGESPTSSQKPEKKKVESKLKIDGTRFLSVEVVLNQGMMIKLWFILRKCRR